MKKHLLVLTIIVLAALTGWMYYLVGKDGGDVELRQLAGDGNTGIFTGVNVSCQIIDDQYREPVFWQQLVFGGENLLVEQAGQKRLSAREAAYIERADMSMSHNISGRDFLYDIASGSYEYSETENYMTVRRYPHDYKQKGDIVHLPVNAYIPGRGYNAWEAIYSFIAPPIVETDEYQYLVTPADYRFSGSASIIRINKWQKQDDLGKIDYDTVKAGENEIYTLLAEVDLVPGREINGLLLHEDRLVLIGSEYTISKDENGDEATGGKGVFVYIYDLQGNLVDSIHHETKFGTMRNACLEGDTLTIITDGQSMAATVFLLEDEISSWGAAHLDYDFGEIRALTYYQPFSARVIKDKLYMAASIALRPVRQEDQYTILYADGKEMHSGYPAWDRQVIELSVYEADSTALYKGIFDVGLDQDLHYKQQPAYKPAVSEVLPERRIISLEIKPDKEG